MANALIGSHPSHGFKVVEQIDSDKQLTRSDSGKLFMCDQQTSVVRVKLPKLSLEIAGWHAKFILRSGAGGSNFNIEGFGSWEGTATDTEDSDTIQQIELGATVQASANKDFVRYGSSSANLGTTIEFYCDGTSWYALSLGKAGNDIEAGG
jgi:hypothetical protein